MIHNTTLIALSGFSIALIVIAAVLLVAVVVLYIVGRKAEKNRLTSRGLWKKIPN